MPPLPFRENAGEFMQISSIVRVGAFGHVGRFIPLEGRSYPRGTDVICRTRRGLEVGEVLSTADFAPPEDALNRPEDAAVGSGLVADGEIVRRMTSEDQLLLLRLQQRRNEAIASCEKLLTEHRLNVTLIEVEQTFDGQSLVFYFLGDMSPEVDIITTELAQAYEQTVQMKQFSELLESGCGPQCGTAEATGCGTASGCASCAIACGIK
ncbi:MAG: PSP1 C-terminal domain-containing protein [Planctomycetota bacterium]|nr:PSP1 C-terminal domain-containing protein [Planctomycetota bacterium]MDA1177678.1 PSP1 C-terminal domain-containing protein [Planctomycetota bacterium]